MTRQTRKSAENSHEFQTRTVFSSEASLKFKPKFTLIKTNDSQTPSISVVRNLSGGKFLVGNSWRQRQQKKKGEKENTTSGEINVRMIQYFPLLIAPSSTVLDLL